MAKVKEKTTGVRNGKLFCFNCGTSHDMHLPRPVLIGLKMIKAFDALHKYCPKIWKEPVPNPDGNSANENASWWMGNGEHGSSSKTIVKHLSGLDSPKDWGNSHPRDPDDFRRCYLLLKAVPQWRAQMDKLRPVSPVWNNLVEQWDDLTQLCEAWMNTEGEISEQNYTAMYFRMKAIGCS